MDFYQVCSIYALWAKLATPLSQGRVAQVATCLTADTCLTSDPGVASSIPTQSHTFTKIDHEIISTAILLHSADSRRVVVGYKRNTLCVFSQMKDIKQIRRDFHTVAWVIPKGWDLGVFGVKNVIFDINKLMSII